MRNESSCLNCTDRHFNCHTNCEKYKAYKERLEIIRQNRLKEREKQMRKKKRW